jgi:putative Mn2+ efflux pump MntP
VLAAVVLAFGLAMDATAVAAVRGLARRAGDAVILPVLFGGAQAGMAALGWALGAWGGRHVATFDHWIAFGLLVLIGGKMIVEALRGGDEEPPPARWSLYLVLALATSIDAAAAGITLPLLAVHPAIALVLIGTITWACSLAGYLGARALGGGRKLEVLGGVILVALGVKILVEHL